MEELIRAARIAFTASELNAAVAGIRGRGERLPPAVMAMSGVDSPPKA